MFELLVATTPARPSWRGSGFGAVLVHAALVAGAVHATATQPDRRPVRQPDTRPINVPPAVPHPAPQPPAPASPGVPSVAAPRIPFEAPTIPPPTLPPIDPAAPSLDPEQLRRLTHDGGTSAPSPFTVEPVGGASGRLVMVAEADEPLTATYMPMPVYPPVLADAGVSGRVVVRFVVDTAGRVEPATVVALTSPHPALTDAVRDALAQARFKPGRSRGVPVRVLAEMPVTFRRVGS